MPAHKRRVEHNRSVLLLPDKDADGLSGECRRASFADRAAGTIMYKTLVHLGLAKDRITVQHLEKGTNVHSESELARMSAMNPDKVIVLDQGSRPGGPLLPQAGLQPRVLIIDHHQSDHFPDEAQILTACKSPPIATAALLTYMLVRDMHPKIQSLESWRALVGVFGGEASSRVPLISKIWGQRKQFGARHRGQAIWAQS